MMNEDPYLTNRAEGEAINIYEGRYPRKRRDSGICEIACAIIIIALIVFVIIIGVSRPF